MISYVEKASKHLKQSKEYGLGLEQSIFAILVMSDDYSDRETIEMFLSLPLDALSIVDQKIAEYESTGEYHVIYSFGKSFDAGKLMKRLTQLRKDSLLR